MGVVNLDTDFLIVGSGMAGLNAALQAAKHGSVVLLTKSARTASSSYWAQGGVAAVMKSPDTFQSHIEDTLLAGRHYGDPESVELLVRDGAGQINDLIELGMPFDKTGMDFDLGLEGGHSNRRILHASGAATGKALVDFFHQQVENRNNIQIIEYAFVYNLIVDENSGECYGVDAYLYNKNRSVRISGRATILATGGYSGLYSRTTNPHTSTGDGLWLAYQHGAALKDLEFIQFHPTAFYSTSGDTFLVSEALRGEGARLYNSSGERFMLKYDDKELAPRDVVSKEIYRQIKRQKEDYVTLDLQHLDVDLIKSQFPALITRIEQQGIRIGEEGIPVAPAAHYCIGGIETDLNGNTAVERLYAVGELGATGVHGANRLASNSLLECLVFSDRAVQHAKDLSPIRHIKPASCDAMNVNSEHKNRFNEIKSVVAEHLNSNVGIERHENELNAALNRFKYYLDRSDIVENNEYFSIRMKGLLTVAQLIAQAALRREGSLGVHNRVDYRSRPDDINKPITFKRHNDDNSVIHKS